MSRDAGAARPPEAPIRLALLGCGFATRLHSRTLRGMHVERWYASRDAARAAEYARSFRGAGSFGSYEEAIGSPRIDAVLIATPPVSHLELTLQALGAGKDVIVEKPPFLSLSDLDQAAEAARVAGRRVFVAENYFYKPLLAAIRGCIEAGDVGEVRVVTINALKRQRTGDWRDDAELSGGGALFEGGIHWINFMANMGLPVRRAHGFRAGGDGGLERTAVVVLEYEQGAVGTLHYSWEVASPLKGLRLSAIYGTEGTITFETNGVMLGVRGRRKRISIPGLRDLPGYHSMFEDFLEAMRTGRAPRFDLTRARRDLELVEQAYRLVDNPEQGENSWRRWPHC
jgi:UDP-N-acetylglucosamine 3-dehydrogenase